MPKIQIQEVLESANVNYGAFLIYSEVIEGARRPLVFFETVTEDFSLIGSTGTQIYVPTATQLSATKLTSSIEDTVVSGFTVANKTISKVTINVTVFIYCAVSFSDILKEDYPNIDWLRLHLHNMGKAVLEQIDADIESTFASGFGTLTTLTTYAGYGDIIDTITAMEAKKWMVEMDNPPFLIVGPEVAGRLVQDTRFLITERYYAGPFPNAMEGEVGMYAGCRVLKTPLLSGTGRAYIVFPPNFKWGPVCILAWKRKMRVREQRYEDKELSIFATTARCIPVVIQTNGIARINMTNTP